MGFAALLWPSHSFQQCIAKHCWLHHNLAGVFAVAFVGVTLGLAAQLWPS